MFDSVAVNKQVTAPAATPADKPQDDATPDDNTIQETVVKPQHDLPPLPKNAVALPQETYSIRLGTVASHGEAFDISKHLPAAYKEKVRIENLEGSDSLSVILDVRLHKKQADELRRALHSTSPNAVVIPSE
jgi:hypothetical protein